MGLVSRRGLLLGVGSSAAAGLVSPRASATIVRALKLAPLVQSSRRIAVVTPLARESRIEDLGRRKRVVTDTRVRVEETLVETADGERELLVRTLGGSVGRLGEMVHGQARLAIGEPCVAFLLQGPDALHYFNGMAQGHYPLRGGARRELMQSPDLPEILDFESSAVKALVGSSLSQATARIRALGVP